MIPLAQAVAIRDRHTPDHQDGYTQRCGLCSFAEHPCDAYRAADALVELLARGGDLARRGCPECTLTNEMDQRLPAMRCVVCGTGFWNAA